MSIMNVDKYTRNNPFMGKISTRYLLTKKGSTKSTYHIELDITPDITFEVGDSVGIYPQNDPAIISTILKLLKCTGKESIFDPKTNHPFTLFEFLLKKANISKCTSAILKMIQNRGIFVDILNPDLKAELTNFLQTHQLIDILERFQPKLDPQELISSLLPMMPRFYSIASSLKTHPEKIHLTVASVSYTIQGSIRHGVGTYFLTHMADETTDVPLFIQPSNGFTLPAPHVPIILIGPGTGVAPFRAFLQERIAMKHTGSNWLFFGERNRQTDFYYEEYFLELEKQNHLQLDLAFSRDSEEKVYVQHKMWRQKDLLWEWIQNGASIYVCGDANKMAKDVDQMLQKISETCGNLTVEQSRQWLKNLRKEKRYLQDVY